MLPFVILAVFLVSLYIILIWLYSLGFKNYPDYIPQTSIAADISATILIPYRNPSQQIQLLLGQLEQQLNGKPKVEVLLIDDSSDKEIVLNSNIEHKVITLKNHRPDLSNTKNNKKEAIALGVEHAKYEYIICLDSDVNLSDNWWKVVSNFIHDKKPKFAAGLHRYLKSNTWLNNFLELEQDILTASSIAALQLRIPTMCNGANMIFSKQAFHDIDGYDGLYHTNGGDDLFLYHRIYKKFSYDTHYIKNMDAAVYSEAPKTISTLLNQRSRWISKTPHYENKWVNVQGGIIIIINIICFLSIVLWFLWPLVFMKIVIDYYLLNQIEKDYKFKESFTGKLTFSLLYPVYVVSVVFRCLFKI
jgi:cellulose synthase/poly-beta-1,6-N-acetylglucosamine synthase-like glycosyltransferase